MPALDSLSGAQGLPAVTADMYACQISAGSAPPCCGSPWTLVIGTRLFGYPIHTTVEYSELKPSSQASTRSVVLPVLAAVGQPIADFTAVPPSTFWCRMLVSSPVIASLSTLTRCGWPPLLSACPSGN